ncbi:Chemotaxis regulator - transmits chemoreceptor signals to flagelllar motor components CheY [Acidisarcina polymorpha]|uniref:Chemotaxis regulator-transmits chemoreceptor signals to flagelllar motor components CheY n=1 Tax=Acidisarcina polymorpha TaxID=2211140 RepID=A0A2Z5G881_9BACT|nr:response regulator [Acidisarcina polymorpha]AXC15027.1 Chemotaxis regulator - transmits chemoreceptor signals to flagelllar motor components CheY [Acidisarcina polymorpha]
MQRESRRVLVVDDEPIIATTLATILRMNGFFATAFTDPVKALASALVDTPDLLISDIVMPGLSGIDLAIQIKALCPKCKVLLFSGQARTVNFLYDAERLGENFHILPKPVHPIDLLKAIREQGAEN